MEGRLDTYRPQRKVLNQNLRKYHGRDPHSRDRKVRTQAAMGGRAELTSDMIVVGEEVCDGVTGRQCDEEPVSVTRQSSAYMQREPWVTNRDHRRTEVKALCSLLSSLFSSPHLSVPPSARLARRLLFVSSSCLVALSIFTPPPARR